jgi:hypothetical protein
MGLPTGLGETRAEQLMQVGRDMPVDQVIAEVLAGPRPGGAGDAASGA